MRTRGTDYQEVGAICSDNCDALHSDHRFINLCSDHGQNHYANALTSFRS